jgi:hypothetical protein
MEPLVAGSRPSGWQVAIAALMASACVLSFASGHIDRQWAALGGLFLTLELTAAVSKTPGQTLSERVWRYFGTTPPRPSRWLRLPIVGLFMLVLGAHFVTGGAFILTGGAAVAITGAPVALVIAYSLVFDRRK